MQIPCGTRCIRQTAHGSFGNNCPATRGAVGSWHAKGQAALRIIADLRFQSASCFPASSHRCEMLQKVSSSGALREPLVVRIEACRWYMRQLRQLELLQGRDVSNAQIAFEQSWRRWRGQAVANIESDAVVQLAACRRRSMLRRSSHQTPEYGIVGNHTDRSSVLL